MLHTGSASGSFWELFTALCHLPDQEDAQRD